MENDACAIFQGPNHSSRGGTVVPELNILAFYKGDEKYVFIYDDDSQSELVTVLRNQAANPELSFNWFDASILRQKAREQALMFNVQTQPEYRIE